LQNIKDKHAYQPAKNMRHTTHPPAASVEMPWLETTYFQKRVHLQDVLCIVTEDSMYLTWS
jgi:hypothetical protein